jgi:hypothetical protein
LPGRIAGGVKISPLSLSSGNTNRICCGCPKSGQSVRQFGFLLRWLSHCRK